MRKFFSKPEHYERNISDAAFITAGPAALADPDGVREPAVVLFSKGKVYHVLPIAEALRLAHQVADAIQEAEGKA